MRALTSYPIAASINDGANESCEYVKVSVVIVSWNARDLLVKCLESITANRCRPALEIIVVDNASQDGSADCVAYRYPEVKLIKNDKNLGFAKANNIGIAVSSGDYLCLINSDALVIEDCLSRLVEHCESHKEVGIVGPLILDRDGRLQRSCRGFPSVWNMLCRATALDKLFANVKICAGYSLTYWPQNTSQDVDILSGCFWLVRRQAMMDVGQLDETFFIYGEDMDWCRRFWRKGWAVRFFPAARAIHYGGGSSSNAPVRFFIERQRADLQYWGKHHSYGALICYFLISCLHMVLRIAGYSIALVFNPMDLGLRHNVERSWACLKWLLSSEGRTLASFRGGGGTPAAT